jgi:methylmalonyl-CoA/ethylmalonyl-CoA epimerase
LGDERALEASPWRIIRERLRLGDQDEIPRGDSKMVKKIDHICVAVRDLDGARGVWEPLLGRKEPDLLYCHEPERIRVARYLVGETALELVESTDPGGPIAKWIEKRGEGLMILSFKVESTTREVSRLESMGYEIVPDSQGRKLRTFGKWNFAFLKPQRLNGVLVELIDWDEGPSPSEKLYSAD